MKGFDEVLKLICGVDDVFYGVCVESVPCKSFEIIMTNWGRSMGFRGRFMGFHTGTLGQSSSQRFRRGSNKL